MGYFFIKHISILLPPLVCLCVCMYLCVYMLLIVCVCVFTPSLFGHVPGVVSSWERTVTTCCFRMQETNTDGRAELIALLWQSSDPSTTPKHTSPAPLPSLLRCDTNTEWHNLMKFCSLKQVAVFRVGGKGGRYENLPAPSAHLFL